MGRRRSAEVEPSATVEEAEETERTFKEAIGRSELLIKEAEVKAQDLLVKARAEADRELRERRRDLSALESKLESREASLDRRVETFERREGELNRRDQSLRSREQNLAEKEREHQAIIEEARAKLETVAGLTREAAIAAVGSMRTQPVPCSHTSSQAWASLSRIT